MKKVRILNIHNTALLIDGKIQNKGGHPTITFHNGSLSVLGSVASKTMQLTTMITWNNALRGVTPPHFHFQQHPSLQIEKLWFKNVCFMNDVKGTFGHFPCIL